MIGQKNWDLVFICSCHEGGSGDITCPEFCGDDRKEAATVVATVGEEDTQLQRERQRGKGQEGAAMDGGGGGKTGIGGGGHHHDTTKLLKAVSRMVEPHNIVIGLVARFPIVTCAYFSTAKFDAIPHRPQRRPLLWRQQVQRTRGSREKDREGRGWRGRPWTVVVAATTTTRPSCSSPSAVWSSRTTSSSASSLASPSSPVHTSPRPSSTPSTSPSVNTPSLSTFSQQSNI